MKDSLGDLRWEVPLTGHHQWLRARYGTEPGRLYLTEPGRLCGPEWLLTSGVPLGGECEVREYNPLTMSSLFLRFLGLRSRHEIQAFADEFGQMGRHEYEHQIIRDGPVLYGEPLSFWRREISSVREAHRQWERQQWAPLQERINARLEVLVRPRLLRDADASDQLRFHLVPRTLLGAIWLQLARAIDGDKQFPACDECGRPFEVSRERHIGKKKSAKFCSGACRQRHWRGTKSARAKA